MGYTVREGDSNSDGTPKKRKPPDVGLGTMYRIEKDPDTGEDVKVPLKKKYTSKSSYMLD